MNKYAELLEKIAIFETIAKAKEVYGPYKLKSGREIVIVRDENGKLRTVSRPKWIMEQHLGRKLDPDKETVEHKDTNFLNNDLNNLELLPRSEHSKLDTKRVKLIDLTCDECGNKFQRSPRLIRMRNKGNASGQFCSRECAGKHNRARQLGKADKLPTPEYRESEYYKLKYAGKNSLIAENIANRIAMQLNHLLIQYASFENGQVDWPHRTTKNGKVVYDIQVWVADNRYAYVRTAIIVRISEKPDVIVVQEDPTANIPQEIKDAISQVIAKVNDEYWYNELETQQSKEK